MADTITCKHCGKPIVIESMKDFQVNDAVCPHCNTLHYIAIHRPSAVDMGRGNDQRGAVITISGSKL